MSEQNKALERRLIEEAWNKGNLAIVDELVAPNFVDHTAPRRPACRRARRGIRRLSRCTARRFRTRR